MRCSASKTLGTVFFLCKDTCLIFAHRTMPHQAVYTFSLHASQSSVGQYSCGYLQEDEKNRKKSALSAARTLTLLPGKPIKMMIGHELPLFRTGRFSLCLLPPGSICPLQVTFNNL